MNKYKTSFNDAGKNLVKTPLVPPDTLANAEKILFVAHLAIGDFLYWQSHLQAFHAAYPHIKIHFFVNELRRTWKWWKWPAMKKYALYDWLETCPFIEKVYSETYSLFALCRTIKRVRREKYPIIVSLASLRPHRYAVLTRMLGPRAFCVGLSNSSGWQRFNILRWLMYRQLDARCSVAQANLASGYHITDLYAAWMQQIFGLQIYDKRPVVKVPRDWQINAKLMLVKWGIAGVENRLVYKHKTVFINIFAKDRKRCWPIAAALELIDLLKQQPSFANAYFIFNAMPGELGLMRKSLENYGASRVVLFSAKEHFFQLPAIVGQCDLVISVETAVMHIAAALKVPVVAIMRTKNPEWVPWDRECSRVLMAAKRSDWVKDIAPARVLEEVKSFLV